jgi:hypothetical protein
MGHRAHVSFLRVLTSISVQFLDGGTISVFSHKRSTIYDTK